jgi:membrane fusion protein, copper/silver efflux system
MRTDASQARKAVAVAPHSGRVSRFAGRTRAMLYALVIAGAVVVAYLATRDDTPGAESIPGHVHDVPAANSMAQPVALSADDARRIGVTYAVATVGPLVREVRTVGQVSVDETAVRTIASRVDGWIDRVTVVSVGQPVMQGQPLLTISSPMLLAAQEELLLAMRMRSELVDATPDARRRAEDLITAARERLAYWQVTASDIAEVERTGEIRRAVAITASTTGFVIEKMVVAGQRVMSGDALYELADLRTVWVEGEVFEQDLATVRVGQTVHADFEALPGDHRMGRISYIQPTLDPQTRTVRVRIVLGNADLRLKPGMYATLRITSAARSDVLTVPRSAVLSTGERSIVFVRESSGALAPREVSIGASADDRVEVIGGLVAGETVVASATFLVDAESNLGTALGGMGDMPGMEMTTPPRRLPMTPRQEK